MIVADKQLYTQFAELFEYPGEDYEEKAGELETALLGRSEYPPSVVESIKEFIKMADDVSLDDLQGIFSYTFEMSSGEHTLDLGYHLFDGFKRTNNLLLVKETFRKFNFPYEEIAKGELPDNLPVFLKFLDFAQDETTVNEFRESLLIKALEKLAKNFEKKLDSPYRHLVNALLAVIDTDVKIAGGMLTEEGEQGDTAHTKEVE